MPGSVCSYTEISPSGNGIHVIAYIDMDKLPQIKGRIDPIYYTKNPHNNDDYFKGVIKGYITEYDKDILTMRDVNEVFSLLSTDLEFVSSKELNTDEGIKRIIYPRR